MALLKDCRESKRRAVLVLKPSAKPLLFEYEMGGAGKP
jgi:hypothetical protein